MKILGVIQANLDTTPLGTKSRLALEIAGVPVIRHTVEQAAKVASLHSVHVLCPAGQAERMKRILDGTRAEAHSHVDHVPPWRSLIRTSRKWSLDGWRGGIGQTVCFDEFTHCRSILEHVASFSFDAVLSIPPAAPLFDPEFAEKMIAHRAGLSDGETHLVFAPAPPGIAGVFLDMSLVKELGEHDLPLSWLFAYQPDQPRRDLLFQECSVEVPSPLRFATGRLCADTDRSFQRLVDLFRDRAEGDLHSIGEWLIRHEHEYLDQMPREIEIELTTDDPFPQNLLHPRGNRVPIRGPIATRTVEKVIREITPNDDTLILLGGFGDPLRHPDFSRILSQIRSAAERNPIYGMAVRTTAVDLTDAVIESLIEHKVDVLNIVLDAWSPALYAKLHAPDEPGRASLEHVLARIHRLDELRQKHGSVCPIILPEFTKSTLNLHELDDFYDGWSRKFGAVCLSGYSDFAAQMENLHVINMAPAVRTACRRIQSRCTILSDGTMAICDQDFKASHAVGSVSDQSLESLWQGTPMNDLRTAHRQSRWMNHPLCANCREWHRP